MIDDNMFEMENINVPKVFNRISDNIYSHTFGAMYENGNIAFLSNNKYYGFHTAILYTIDSNLLFETANSLRYFNKNIPTAEDMETQKIKDISSYLYGKKLYEYCLTIEKLNTNMYFIVFSIYDDLDINDINYLMFAGLSMMDKKDKYIQELLKVK